MLKIYLVVLQNARVDSRELKGYMIFLEKVKTSAVFLRDSTAISHYPLLLFGGSHLRVDHTKGTQKISIVESNGEYAFTVGFNLDMLIHSNTRHRCTYICCLQPQGDVWLEFRAEARVGVLFKLLREELDRLLLAQIEAPGDDGNLSAGAAGSTAVSAVLQLLEDEERQALY